MIDEEFKKFKKETQDTITNLKGQIDEQRQEIERLKKKSLTSSPIEISRRDTIEYNDIKTYNLLKVYKLYGGIPIYNTITGLSGFGGQAFLINATTTTPSKRIAFQIGNTVSSVALT